MNNTPVGGSSPYQNYDFLDDPNEESELREPEVGIDYPDLDAALFDSDLDWEVDHEGAVESGVFNDLVQVMSPDAANGASAPALLMSVSAACAAAQIILSLMAEHGLNEQSPARQVLEHLSADKLVELKGYYRLCLQAEAQIERVAAPEGSEQAEEEIPCLESYLSNAPFASLSLLERYMLCNILESCQQRQAITLTGNHSPIDLFIGLLTNTKRGKDAAEQVI